jgi:hypothetical protein
VIPRETIGKRAWTLAVATAITGGVVALSLPATAQAGTEVRNVPGHRVAHDIGHAPASLVVTTRQKPVGDDDDEKKCCKKCPPGLQGLPGPRGRGDGIDSAMATPTGLAVAAPVRYIGLAQGNGPTFIRDFTSIGPANPPWHDLSTVLNYPGNVNDVTLSAAEATNLLHVTVRTTTGLVRQTTCTLTVNATWPANCTAFVDFTPPL